MPVQVPTAYVALTGDDLRTCPTSSPTPALRSGSCARTSSFLCGAILVIVVSLAALGVLGVATVVAIHQLAEVVDHHRSWSDGESRQVSLQPPPALPR